MPDGVTTLSGMIRDLHHEILIICTITAVLLFGVMGYALFAFRKSRGVKAATFSHNTTAEVIWTIVPIFVLIYMAVPSARAILEIEDSSNPDLTIKVTGYQWKWGYEYLDTGVEFYANMDQTSAAAARLDSGIDVMDIEHYLRDVDKRMVVPVGKKVRILLTADDVIHAWWVPQLYIKKDAIPGFVNEMWFTATETGVFRGQCAAAAMALCPLWLRWLAKQTMRRGLQIMAAICLPLHPQYLQQTAALPHCNQIRTLL
jgi:cytochrome c oxidase subunit II